ncbi:hypothetical protein BS47DRAFT_1368919 [Hydnum rufescens UP504]|uniref:Uncharacterized protein n=1 Tax=Hydnum rufescens UP504 TaxID=1448309 RepID=A0A9P6DGR3_9AGAM|nr:hypothetical protein BS47DRAFT_1368919 [Hydnum rufescens UP504]
MTGFHIQSTWTDKQGSKLLVFLCNAETWTVFQANQAQGFRKAVAHMGGTKSTTAICSWFDHALGHFKYIKSLEDHTGGGNGDDIGDELGSIKKEGHPDLNKCTSLTIEHFKDMGWYDLFNNCCGSKADVTKTINLNSTQSKPIDKKQSQPDNSGDTDDESNADELPCGKHHCHAGRSTGQDVVDEKIELSRCQMHVTEGIGSAFTTIASTYANSIRADDT